MTFVASEDAAEILRSGGVILVPTDTVVGLVASQAGLSRMARMKDRDPDKPIAVLCRTANEAFSLASGVPPLAYELARRFWPGPLTLVLDDPGGGTVGVRMPDASAVRDLLFAYGEPLHATSANPAEEPAPRALESVHPRLHAAVDAVLEGTAGSGEASAVVDLSSGRVRLLRPTAELTEEALLRIGRSHGEP